MTPNVKINWQFAYALQFEFNFDDGDMIFCYRPEDNQIDIDPNSRLYKQAEWLIREDDNLFNYMCDRADEIIADINKLINDKYQKGYVDIGALLDHAEYNKWTS